MADQKSSDLPVVSTITTTDGFIVLDPEDTSSVAESGSGGTLKTVPWSTMVSKIEADGLDLSSATTVLVPDATSAGEPIAYGQGSVSFTSLTVTSTLNISGVSQVLVPNADATGEALAFGQSAWELGSGTLTGNLDASGHSVAVTGVTLANGIVTLAAAAPIVRFQDSDATADHKNFDIRTVGDELRLQALSDDYLTTVNAIRIAGDDGAVNMSGASAVYLPVTTLYGDLNLEESTPLLQLYKTDGTVDERKLRMLIASGSLAHVRGVNSVGGTTYDFLTFDLSSGDLDLSGATSVSLPDVEVGAAGATFQRSEGGTAQVAIVGDASAVAQLAIDGGSQSRVYFRDDTGASVNYMMVAVDGGNFDFYRGDFGTRVFTVTSSDEIQMNLASSVTVPDATADGHALAYDQASWRLGTGEIRSTAPNIRWYESDQAADSRYWRIGTFNGALVFHPTTDALADQSSPLSLQRDGSIDIQDATGDGHPVAAADVDGTLNQLQLQGGYEVGNTGARDVSASLKNSWTADEFVIQRTGNVVEIYLYNGGSGASDNLYTIPVGFRPRSNIPLQAISSLTPSADGAVQTGYIVAGTGEMWLDTVGKYLQVTYITDEAWPASLPGSAA